MWSLFAGLLLPYLWTFIGQRRTKVDCYWDRNFSLCIARNACFRLPLVSEDGAIIPLNALSGLPRVVPIVRRGSGLDPAQTLLHLPRDADVVGQDPRVVMPVVTGFVCSAVQVLPYEVREGLVIIPMKFLSLDLQHGINK